MDAEPSSRPPRLWVPKEYSPDALSWYIYRHFAYLLTDEELAAERVLIGRVKQLAYSDPSGTKVLEVFRIPEVQAKYPELMRRINEHGPASVMRAAAERVLRDNPGKQILHTCAKCGELCLTPRAQQCFACGFDWHPKQGE
jgi:hypothetical protein